MIQIAALGGIALAGLAAPVLALILARRPGPALSRSLPVAVSDGDEGPHLARKPARLAYVVLLVLLVGLSRGWIGGA